MQPDFEKQFRGQHCPAGCCLSHPAGRAFRRQISLQAQRSCHYSQGAHHDLRGGGRQPVEFGSQWKVPSL